MAGRARFNDATADTTSARAKTIERRIRRRAAASVGGAAVVRVVVRLVVTRAEVIMR
jgi:hypothetical protein